MFGNSQVLQIIEEFEKREEKVEIVDGQTKIDDNVYDDNVYDNNYDDVWDDCDDDEKGVDCYWASKIENHLSLRRI